MDEKYPEHSSEYPEGPPERAVLQSLLSTWERESQGLRIKPSPHSE